MPLYDGAVTEEGHTVLCVQNEVYITGRNQRNDRSFRCSDDETEVDLLIPVEGALNSDPRVFRAKGIDSLPAIGIQVRE